MPELSGFPFAEVEFDRDAKVVGGHDEALALAEGSCTDLIVMAQGWRPDLVVHEAAGSRPRCGRC